MSGLAHVTLPVPVSEDPSLDEVWVVGSAGGLLVAIDIEGTGHISTYPSDQPTVSLQIPFRSMEDIPAHHVVASGPCHFNSTAQ